MAREIKARVSHGKIELPDDIELPEGEEVTILVKDTPSAEEASDAFERSIGAWKGQLDIDAFLEELYATRRSQSREILL